MLLALEEEDEEDPTSPLPLVLEEEEPHCL